MRNNSTIARLISASLALGASAFASIASLAGVDEQYGLIRVNYPTCVENPNDPSCQVPQGTTQRSHRGKGAAHEHHNRGA
jgi:hypothetical protein